MYVCMLIYTYIILYPITTLWSFVFGYDNASSRTEVPSPREGRLRWLESPGRIGPWNQGVKRGFKGLGFRGLRGLGLFPWFS